MAVYIWWTGLVDWTTGLTDLLFEQVLFKMTSVVVAAFECLELPWVLVEVLLPELYSFIGHIY